MRALPRLLAVTTDAVCDSDGFERRAAAIAGAGAATALVVRAPGASTARHAALAQRALELARPLEASVIVHARPDLAAAIGAQGVQLRREDLPPRDARRVLRAGWLGVSVHGREEAVAAIDEGADYLLAGNLFETTSHPGRPARGLAWLEELCTLGRPVIAIGGITPERAAAVQRAGAWGAAAISALWDAPDPGAAALAMLLPWSST